MKNSQNEQSDHAVGMSAREFRNLYLGESTMTLEEKIAASERPDSLVWHRPSDNAFIPFGGGRTRADWEKIGAHSNSINQGIPDD